MFSGLELTLSLLLIINSSLIYEVSAPEQVEEPTILLQERYQDAALDSCDDLLVIIEAATEDGQGDILHEEFVQLFDKLDLVSNELSEADNDRLDDLYQRSWQLYSLFLETLAELPEDVSPEMLIKGISNSGIHSEIFDSLEILFGIDEDEFSDEQNEIYLDSIQSDARFPAIPLISNRKVDQAVKYFLTKGRKVMQRWLDRSATMIPVMLPVLREEGMPDELVYLAMIESGFKTNAYSYAHAVGPWQFISGTGRRYDLSISWWYDERRDPILSTKAASAYLGDLYGMFGDWYLAMASYNCGENKVKRMIRTYGEDYWAMRKLPRQTRNYIPSYLAAVKIAKDPESYGFISPTFIEPALTESIIIRECVSMEALAGCSGIDENTLKALNPAIVRWCTPPDRDSVRVVLPAGTVNEDFWDRFAAIPAEKRVSYIRHRVKSGETISTIARRYRIPQNLIVNHPQNKIRNRHRIKVGQTLIIPGIPPGKKEKKASYWDEPRDLAYNGGYHKVRRGENLWDIARNYGVTVTQLKRWNGLWGKRFIHPNQKLRINSSSTKLKINDSEKIDKSGRYTVVSGDTLWHIARRYKVSIDAIRKANGLSKGSLIKPGQRLTIPHK